MPVSDTCGHTTVLDPTSDVPSGEADTHPFDKDNVGVGEAFLESGGLADDRPFSQFAVMNRTLSPSGCDGAYCNALHTVSGNRSLRRTLPHGGRLLTFG